MDQITKSYFERSVSKYSRGDVKALLQSKLPCAGPLLVTILNGIDNLGGMCYGFGQSNVGARSIKFLHKKMGLSEALAKFLYESVRCGIVHQGMPKMGLEFYVQYDGTAGGEIVYDQSGRYIILDVTEFARHYLKTIEKIAAEPEKHINDHPRYTEGDKIGLKALFDDAKEDIASGTGLSTRRLYEADEDNRRATGQSSAAYTGEMQYCIDLPPYDE